MNNYPDTPRHQCCQGVGPCLNDGCADTIGRDVGWHPAPIVLCHSPGSQCRFKHDWYHNYYCICPVHEAMATGRDRWKVSVPVADNRRV